MCHFAASAALEKSWIKYPREKPCRSLLRGLIDFAVQFLSCIDAAGFGGDATNKPFDAVTLRPIFEERYISVD